MFKKLSLFVALTCLFGVAEAVTVPGESAWCVANCVNGVCVPVVTTVGATNYPIGAPLLVYAPGFGGNPFHPAQVYQWGKTLAPAGAADNIGGLSSDFTDVFTFGQVEAADAGLYIEVGSAAGADTAINWCVTVN